MMHMTDKGPLFAVASINKLAESGQLDESIVYAMPEGVIRRNAGYATRHEFREIVKATRGAIGNESAIIFVR